MAIFNSYVSLPEGSRDSLFYLLWWLLQWSAMDLRHAHLLGEALGIAPGQAMAKVDLRIFMGIWPFGILNIWMCHNVS